MLMTAFPPTTQSRLLTQRLLIDSESSEGIKGVGSCCNVAVLSVYSNRIHAVFKANATGRGRRAKVTWLQLACLIPAFQTSQYSMRRFVSRSISTTQRRKYVSLTAASCALSLERYFRSYLIALFDSYLLTTPRAQHRPV